MPSIEMLVGTFFIGVLLGMVGIGIGMAYEWIRYRRDKRRFLRRI
jgi:hypothetical protein